VTLSVHILEAFSRTSPFFLSGRGAT